MYCQRCGFHNDTGSQTCHICHTVLTPGYEPSKEVLSVNLANVPLNKILRTANIKNPLLLLLTFIIVTYTYIMKRLTRQPYLVPIMNSTSLKLHLSNIHTINKLDKKSFGKVTAFLNEIGFTPFVDIQNRSNIQETVVSIFINRKYRIYTNVFVQKATGRITEINFSAITAAGKVIQYTNGFEVTVRDDRNVECVSFPGVKIEELWNKFIIDPQRSVEQRLCPEPEFLFPIHLMEYKRLLEIGIEQHFFHVGNKKTGVVPSALLTCAQHAFAPAVRRCTKCETAMCEACYEEVHGEFYCKTCAAQPEMSQRRENRLKAPWGFAGLGVRLFASTIDIAVVVLGVGMAYGLLRLASNAVPWRLAEAAAFTLWQIVAVTFTVAYFIVPIVKDGRTLGKRLWGVRIIDSRGVKPGLKTAIVRFASGVISLLFIFPVIGYLFIPFKKNKRGFNDLLADTLVITKYSGRKSLLAWLGMGPAVGLMLLLIGSAGYRISEQFRTGGATVALESEWNIGSDKNYNYFKIRKNGCLISTADALLCLDILSGDTLWELGGLDYPEVKLGPGDSTWPLLITHNNDSLGCDLISVNDINGDVQWRQKLEGDSWWNLTADSSSVIAYTNSQIKAFSLSGDLLWNKNLTIPEVKEIDFEHVSVDLSSNYVVVQKFGDDKTVLEKWERETGDVIIPENTYIAQLFPCGELFHIVTDTAKKWTLVNNETDDTLWESTEISDYPVECTFNDDGTPRIIYGRNNAYNGINGIIEFAYPDSLVFEKLLDSLLLLANKPKFDFESFGTAMSRKSWRFVDPLTGKLKYALKDSSLRSLVPIGENDRTMFFAARPAMKTGNLSAAVSLFNIFFPTKEMKEGQNEFIVKINKFDYSTEKILAGSLIGLESSRLFPESDRIFICGGRRAGLYMLPSNRRLADVSHM